MVKPATGKSVQSEERRDSDGFKYKGVRKRKWGKFVSEIRLPNCRERIWLGSYDSAEKAARAFDAAQVCLRGCSARLNFPGSSSLKIPSRPLTHQDIQMIASQFANSGPAAQPPLPGTASKDSSELSRDRSDSGRVSPHSPSHSISAGLSLEDSTSGTSFMDLLVESGPPECYKPLDYGIFPGFDDFTNDFYHQTVQIAEFGDEKFDDLSEFFLWNY